MTRVMVLAEVRHSLASLKPSHVRLECLFPISTKTYPTLDPLLSFFNKSPFIFFSIFRCIDMCIDK